MEKSKIPDTTIETLTRNFFKESLSYGFQYEDYLKYVNVLLEYAIDIKKSKADNKTFRNDRIEIANVEKLRLPVELERILIRNANRKTDLKLIDEWQKDKFGRYFLLSMTNSQDSVVENLINSKYNKFGIITLKDEIPIGVVAFLNIDRVHKKAELRKLIGVPEQRAHGYGKVATRYWIKYGFTNSTSNNK